MLVAANQPVIGGQYPHPLGSAYSYGWRSQEILDQLRQTSTLTLDEAEALLYDDTIRIAADLVPALLKVKVADTWVAEGQHPGRLGLLGHARLGARCVLQRGDAQPPQADLPGRATG